MRQATFRDIRNENDEEQDEEEEEEEEFVTVDQFKKKLKSLDENLEEAELEALAKEADTKQSGKITESDFKHLLTTTKSLVPLLTKFMQEQNTEEEEEHHEDLSTRLFLSHKRITGQGIVGRLYEGLKDDYSIFLDSEAKFKIHNLKMIVQSTKVVIFLLTHGILQSIWCCEELKSAMENNKKIIVVRDIAFKMPDTIPDEWQSSLGVLLKGKTDADLVWMAEYNSDCIRKLKKMIGPPDEVLKYTEEYLSEKTLVDKLRNEGVFEVEGHQQGFVKCLQWLHSDLPQPTSAKFIRSVADEEYFGFIKGVHSLCLEGCGGKTDSSVLTSSAMRQLHFDALIKHIGAGLETLELVACFGMNLAVLVKECPKLQSLILRNCDQLTNDALKQLADSTSLRHLVLVKPDQFNSSGMANLASGLPNLISFDIENCDKLGWGIESTQRFIESHPKLQRLVIRNCAKKSAIVSSIIKCQELTYLDLYNHENLSDQNITTIAASCSKLQTFILEGVKNLTDKTLQAIGASCGELKEINLMGVADITDTGIKHLLGCSKLRAVSLSCAITDKGLSSLTELKDLRTLKLARCKSITDTGIQTLVQGNPHIEFVRLESCPVTDLTLQAIRQHCANLQTLELRYLDKVTESGFEAVARMPSLKILVMYSCGLEWDFVYSILEQLPHLQFRDL